MYIYIYIYVHTYTHTHTYIIYICTYTDTYIYIHIYIYIACIYLQLGGYINRFLLGGAHSWVTGWGFFTCKFTGVFGWWFWRTEPCRIMPLLLFWTFRIDEPLHGWNPVKAAIFDEHNKYNMAEYININIITEQSAIHAYKRLTFQCYDYRRVLWTAVGSRRCICTW